MNVNVRLWMGAGVRWGVLLGYVALVSWLSLAPGRVLGFVPCVVPFQDKVAHFFMYGVLVFLGCWAVGGLDRFCPSGKPRWRAWWLVLAGGIVYGGLMEVLQGALVPACRAFELGDIVANSLGALVFFWGARRFSTAKITEPAEVLADGSLQTVTRG